MEREWVHAARVTAGAKHTLDAECTKGIRFQAKDELLRAIVLCGVQSAPKAVYFGKQ